MRRFAVDRLVQVRRNPEARAKVLQLPWSAIMRLPVDRRFGAIPPVSIGAVLALAGASFDAIEQHHSYDQEHDKRLFAWAGCH
ncbi:hypothetical protein NOVOSPHI9U_370022 [Novosphingobium sp. 9U]|nr:hypothetical protein NOVOSPHI9U_370022 [Novosphingobium sp. 9U]